MRTINLILNPQQVVSVLSVFHSEYLSGFAKGFPDYVENVIDARVFEYAHAMGIAAVEEFESEYAHAMGISAVEEINFVCARGELTGESCMTYHSHSGREYVLSAIGQDRYNFQFNLSSRVAYAILMAATDMELLAAWMEAAGGLTQAQAAEMLGMSQPGVHAVLSGKSRLSKVGRQFVRHLLSEIHGAPPAEIPAAWPETLRQVASEMSAQIEAQRMARAATPAHYTDDEYIMSDVG